MWVMVQRIRRQLMRLLEPFRLAMRMVGPGIYKVSTLLWMDSFVPIVGRVSMDQITVRLPKVYPLGTPVTLMGENGGASITATEVAEKRGTINYEVLCLLSDRVPRSYD